MRPLFKSKGRTGIRLTAFDALLNHIWSGSVPLWLNAISLAVAYTVSISCYSRDFQLNKAVDREIHGFIIIPLTFIKHAESNRSRCHAITLIIKRHYSTAALLYEQAKRNPIERLISILFTHAQEQRFVQWI